MALQIVFVVINALQALGIPIRNVNDEAEINLSMIRPMLRA